MNFREVIEQNMGRDVKIGFQKGFIYCDKVSEKTLIEIESMSKSYENNTKVQIDKLNIEIKNLQEEVNKMLAKGSTVEKDIVMRKRKQHIIRHKKDRVTALRASLKKFIPYLEAEADEGYMSEDGSTIIFTSKDNRNIIGPYWDADEYKRRHKKKQKTSSPDPKKCDTVDDLLRFFASQYGHLLCGNIDPDFIVKEFLDADIYLVY